MRAWIDRVFTREEMDGNGRCPTYLVRWTLLKLWGGRSVYLHKFVGDDWSRDLHDHPKRFVSIGPWGHYAEWTPPRDTNWYNDVKIWSAPWLRSFPADHIHRITGPTPERPCWTLVIVLKSVRRWGFWHDGRFVGWREYVNSKAATEMKSCAD